VLWLVDCQRTKVNDVLNVKSVNDVLNVVNQELKISFASLAASREIFFHFERN
jgi:hypothetical protein